MAHSSNSSSSNIYTMLHRPITYSSGMIRVNYKADVPESSENVGVLQLVNGFKPRGPVKKELFYTKTYLPNVERNVSNSMIQIRRQPKMIDQPINYIRLSRSPAPQSPQTGWEAPQQSPVRPLNAEDVALQTTRKTRNCRRSSNATTNVPEPKKRGRKPKAETEKNTAEVLPKRRGRKPKIVTEPKEAPTELPKKRGRKSKKVVEPENDLLETAAPMKRTRKRKVEDPDYTPGVLPKKRARKPKSTEPENNMQVAIIPKKRGRKPKIKEPPPELSTCTDLVLVKVPKKRGRKPKNRPAEPAVEATFTSDLPYEDIVSPANPEPMLAIEAPPCRLESPLPMDDPGNSETFLPTEDPGNSESFLPMEDPESESNKEDVPLLAIEYPVAEEPLPAVPPTNSEEPILAIEAPHWDDSGVDTETEFPADEAPLAIEAPPSPPPEMLALEAAPPREPRLTMHPLLKRLCRTQIERPVPAQPPMLAIMENLSIAEKIKIRPRIRRSSLPTLQVQEDEDDDTKKVRKKRRYKKRNPKPKKTDEKRTIGSEPQDKQKCDESDDSLQNYVPKKRRKKVPSVPTGWVNNSFTPPKYGSAEKRKMNNPQRAICNENNRKFLRDSFQIPIPSFSDRTHADVTNQFFSNKPSTEPSGNSSIADTSRTEVTNLQFINKRTIAEKLGEAFISDRPHTKVMNQQFSKNPTIPEKLGEAFISDRSHTEVTNQKVSNKPMVADKIGDSLSVARFYKKHLKSEQKAEPPSSTILEPNQHSDHLYAQPHVDKVTILLRAADELENSQVPKNTESHSSQLQIVDADFFNLDVQRHVSVGDEGVEDELLCSKDVLTEEANNNECRMLVLASASSNAQDVSHDEPTTEALVTETAETVNPKIGENEEEDPLMRQLRNLETEVSSQPPSAEETISSTRNQPYNKLPKELADHVIDMEPVAIDKTEKLSSSQPSDTCKKLPKELQDHVIDMEPVVLLNLEQKNSNQETETPRNMERSQSPKPHVRKQCENPTDKPTEIHDQAKRAHSHKPEKKDKHSPVKTRTYSIEKYERERSGSKRIHVKKLPKENDVSASVVPKRLSSDKTDNLLTQKPEAAKLDSQQERKSKRSSARVERQREKSIKSPTVQITKKRTHDEMDPNRIVETKPKVVNEKIVSPPVDKNSKGPGCIVKLFNLFPEAPVKEKKKEKKPETSRKHVVRAMFAPPESAVVASFRKIRR